MSEKPQNLDHPVVGRFYDFDRFAEATRGWDLEFRQLDRGPLSAEVVQVCSRESVLMRVQFSRALDQLGCSPRGFLTFGFLDDGVSGVRWCGRETNDHSLLAFDEAGGFDAISRPGFGGYTYSVTEERLVRVAELLGLPDYHRLSETAKKIPSGQSSRVVDLRSQARDLCNAMVNDAPQAIKASRLQDELDFELPRRLLSVIASASGSPRRDSARSRRVALNKARAFIRDNLDLPLTVRKVCEHTGVSWRTLDYAFRDSFDMTPQSYLRAVRLDATRRHLRSGSYTTVAEAANRSGFWHMGKFAADYRSQFGELPSKTLRRSAR